MARLNCIVTSRVTIDGGSSITALQLIASSSLSVAVKQVRVSMKQTTIGAPSNETARVQILRQSAMVSGTTATPQKLQGSLLSQSIISSARSNTGSAADEPATSAGGNLTDQEVTFALGAPFEKRAFKESEELLLQAGSAVGVKISPQWPAGTSREFITEIEFEE
jgi:hypothetical protein